MRRAFTSFFTYERSRTSPCPTIFQKGIYVSWVLELEPTDTSRLISTSGGRDITKSFWRIASPSRREKGNSSYDITCCDFMWSDFLMCSDFLMLIFFSESGSWNYRGNRQVYIEIERVCNRKFIFYLHPQKYLHELMEFSKSVSF